MEYDHRELENVLRSRGVHNECPSCGEKDPDWQHTTVLGLSGLDKDGVLNNETIRVAGLICSQCGYTRLYTLGMLGVPASEAD